MIKPKKLINRMTIWKQWMDKDINIFHIEKYVVAIYWKDNDSDNKGYWEFDTLINSRKIPSIW